MLYILLQLLNLLLILTNLTLKLIQLNLITSIRFTLSELITTLDLDSLNILNRTNDLLYTYPSKHLLYNFDHHLLLISLLLSSTLFLDKLFLEIELFLRTSGMPDHHAGLLIQIQYLFLRYLLLFEPDIFEP